MLFIKRKLYLGVLMAVFAHAECTKSYGGLSCGAGVVDSVHDVGNVTLTGTTVKNTTTVSGQLTASQAMLNALVVNGKVQLTETDVKGKSNIRGFMQADKTTFHNVLNLHANEAEFVSSTTQAIHMKPTEGSAAKLHLSGSTIVQGNVDFKPAGGVILLDGGSKIMGKVVGATVKQVGESNAG